MTSLCKIKGYVSATFAFLKKASELEALHCAKQYLSKVQY